MSDQIQQNFRLSPYWVDSINTPGFDWNKFQDKIDATPDDLYNILVAEQTINFIRSLTQKHISLSTQGSDITRIIRDVVIADVFIGDMPRELSRRLGIDQQLAREIANQIVSQLFTPVLEDLKKIHNEKYPGRLPNKPVAQQQSTPLEPAVASGVLPLTGQAPPPQKYPGEELPESGGNIIDLRNK
ncbi:MAG: hypothetical protein AAB784_02040 [Patescibacteria group bacterium]